MPINECCNVGVVCCESNASISEVASLMRKHHVGDIIVIKKFQENRIPIGIVTDRDIVIETIAPQVNMDLITASDIMSTPLVTVHEQTGFLETLQMMRQRKVRRMPVVTSDGTLYGIVTADDIINLLALELSIMTGTMVEQPFQEQEIRP